MEGGGGGVREGFPRCDPQMRVQAHLDTDRLGPLEEGMGGIRNADEADRLKEYRKLTLLKK